MTTPKFTPPFPWSPELRSIWRYCGAYQPQLRREHWVTLEEGCTPLSEVPELAGHLGLPRLWLKREDLNPNGSQKDRSAAYQVSWARQNGYSLVTISSSGNAALSTAAYCARAGLRLIAQIAPQTNLLKVARMLKFGARVVASKDPIRFARYIEKVYGIPNLRPSTSPIAAEGYQSLGYELIESGTPVEALFLYASSASTLVGIAQALFTYAEANPGYRPPQLHAVQAGLVNSLAVEWGLVTGEAERSIVGDLGAKKTKRTAQALDYIRRSGGEVWYVGDGEILAALELLNKTGIDTSYEGAAALAGARRAGRAGRSGPAACILTGQHYPDLDLPFSPAPLTAESFEDMDRIVTSLNSLSGEAALS
jgi:threonine synthase